MAGQGDGADLKSLLAGSTCQQLESCIARLVLEQGVPVEVVSQLLRDTDSQKESEPPNDDAYLERFFPGDVRNSSSASRKGSLSPSSHVARRSSYSSVTSQKPASLGPVKEDDGRLAHWNQNMDAIHKAFHQPTSNDVVPLQNKKPNSKSVGSTPSTTDQTIDELRKFRIQLPKKRWDEGLEEDMDNLSARAHPGDLDDLQCPPC